MSYTPAVIDVLRERRRAMLSTLELEEEGSAKRQNTGCVFSLPAALGISLLSGLSVRLQGQPLLRAFTLVQPSKEIRYAKNLRLRQA